MLASIVTRATGIGLKSKVTSAAMLQLKSACELFAEAASYGGRAVKFLVKTSWRTSTHFLKSFPVAHSATPFTEG